MNAHYSLNSATIPCPPPMEDEDVDLLLDEKNWTVDDVEPFSMEPMLS